MDMQAENDQCVVKSSAFGNRDVDQKRPYKDVEKNEKVLCELEIPTDKQTAHVVLVKHREDPQEGHEDMRSEDKQAVMKSEQTAPESTDESGNCEACMDQPGIQPTEDFLISAVESVDQPSCIRGYMDQTVLESSKIKETNSLETKLQPEEQEPVRAGSNEEEKRRKLKAGALNEATEECNQDEELDATQKIMAQGTLLAWKVLRESLKELREEATEWLVQFCASGLKQKKPMRQGSREKQSIEERRQQRKSWSSDDIQAMRDENGEVDRERDDGREDTDRSLDQKWLSDKGRTEFIQTESHFSSFFQNKLANNQWRDLSRTKKSTLEHRELFLERARFIHRKRCLHRQSMCSTQLTMEQGESGEAGESEGKGAREPGNHKWNLRNKEKGEEEEPEKNEEQRGQKWLGKSKYEPGKKSMHKKKMQRRDMKVITTKTTGVLGTKIKGIREMEKNKQTENTTGKAELKRDTAVKADQKANMAQEKQTREPKNQKASENRLKKVEYGITLGGSIYMVEGREGEKMTIGPCIGHPDTTREQKAQSECHRSAKDTMEVMVREAQVRAIEQVQCSQIFNGTQRSKKTGRQDYLSDSMDSKAKGRAVEGKKEERSSSRKGVPENMGKGPERRGGPPDTNPKRRDGVHVKAVERRDRMGDWCSCSEVPDMTSGHGVPRHTEYNYLVNKHRNVTKWAQECQTEYAGVKQYTEAGRTGWREWRRKNKNERGGNKMSGVVSRGKSKGERDGDQRYAHRRKRSPEDEAEGYCVTRSGRKGTWEVSVCESDPLCDTTGLVSPPNPESQIRNRRLSPGSGNSGGGGGGGGRVNRDTCQNLPPLSENHTHRHPYGHTSTPDREKERRGQPHSRSFRKEAPRAGRAAERGQRERWVEDSLSLLKPPPAFPVQDSPAKLQPAVSYASKVKQGGVGSVAEDLPGIGVLLQNQWGLSFISDSPQNADSSGPPAQNGPSHGSPLVPSFGSGVTDPTGNDFLVSDGSVPTVSMLPAGKCGLEAESPPELLLGCRHLVEALRYHTQEWDAIYRQHEEDPAKVVWYKDLLDHPA
ncbi:uncharacterized protein si:ch211-214j24.10 isoform X2 [Brienomyrus brachyistius]|uniref:uncharacterized protein si:ch211-214j24.10 isoform X2 n=1 Tax=Brienomyrus brachyistius TaxID=42636 RepID=UPI0020B3AA4A|nr:uncharacterized protein si:ch211-214j24.10 isoform X2 [Brienomyrus brachyistius]